MAVWWKRNARDALADDVVSTEVVVDLLTSILYGIQALLVSVGICG